MKEHNKLVRNHIPEIISSKGATAHIRQIETDAELEIARQQKAASNGRFDSRIFLISTEG